MMRKIILGTDWWTDCDDAVALRLICRAIKDKAILLLGIGVNACMEYSISSLKGFLKAEGVADIPVGIDLNATDFGGNPPYQKRLAEAFCPDVLNSDAEDAVRLYRRILASEKGKLDIIEIGYPQVLANLLKSCADDISEKSGLELVSEKVSKFWVMAGKWDADGEKENNFCRNSRSRVAGKEFCKLCPIPVTFLGWEIGYGVITGGNLKEDDHLYKVLCDHGSKNGRHSWDPMLVLMALIGDEEKAGYRTVSGTASVNEQTGANYFKANPNGIHKFVVKKYENDYYEELINNLI
ncbi:MAG: hypothetical protein J6S14_00945 [Clostridia bacterium]|nr:hypothetical protein [Clostridia bacterium]